MAVDLVPFGGWKNNLRLTNDHAELIVTLDVGPRVISYRTRDGANVFKTFASQLGGVGEAEWMIRGGHRFWLAPEHPVLTYAIDNTAVAHRLISEHAVETDSPPSEQVPIRRLMMVSLDPDSSRVTVTHRAINEGRETLRYATWGLSVMAPGGIEIIPLPPLGEHPRDLLPNRMLIFWPYTEMTDPRWRWAQRFITLQQANAGPLKFGLGHREKWIGYHNATSLFLKRIEFCDDATYPDMGCNFETFTNEEMLEVESLGPLADLAPGAAIEHTEHWQLFENVSAPPCENEEDIAQWIAPWLTRSGFSV